MVKEKRIISVLIVSILAVVSLFAACTGSLHEDNRDLQPEASRTLEVGAYKLLYPSEYINDHCVIYDADNGKWHMYGIQKGHRSFIHLTAKSLTQSPWMRETDFTYRGREIWAPHVITWNNKYWMYFTAIGTPRQIVLSTTVDLAGGAWTHYANNPILAQLNPDGSDGKNKDCMLLRAGDQWIMYYSMVKGKVEGKDYWVVGYSTSRDLLNWSKPRIAFDEDPPADPGVESPFVVHRGKYYYLFLSARPWPDGGVDVFRSESPYRWNPKQDFIKRFPKEPTKAHAMEIVQDLDGKWYITRCGPKMGGWWIAPIVWNDGQDTVESDANKAMVSDKE